MTYTFDIEGALFNITKESKIVDWKKSFAIRNNEGIQKNLEYFVTFSL